ncbi:hypothetical protein M407DRAFT_181810 [Tulasnella calospora MUT 4182]|uniref:RNB domain-containing protein n=1 Tax=Tulasnella calospora MUT 4182 TaxID=1051891 RepID=A0A0C3QCE7_9AGAM|nr:hypothetical protein M407DRAFT_181810 [Tulasnella calospora MUT 4182]
MVNTAGGTSTVPGANSMLGTEGDPYARVTSPLRRFGDLVNHWQLKACMSPQRASNHARRARRDSDGGRLDDSRNRHQENSTNQSPLLDFSRGQASFQRKSGGSQGALSLRGHRPSADE